MSMSADHEVQTIAREDISALKVGNDFRSPFSGKAGVDQEGSAIWTDDKRAIALLHVDVMNFKDASSSPHPSVRESKQNNAELADENPGAETQEVALHEGQSSSSERHAKVFWARYGVKLVS
jgi:hypothetical protein